MSGYVYGRTLVVPDKDEAREAWADYESRNRLANLTYEEESPTIDRRYDPSRKRNKAGLY